jgi:hypothetical protein
MGKFCTSCGTEAATTMMDAGIGKAATSFGGTVVGELAEAANVGGDLTDALVEGTVKGTFNAASGAVGDAYGDAVGGTYGRDARQRQHDKEGDGNRRETWRSRL